jgi:sugar (pentulose or hexulose) kinase
MATPVIAIFDIGKTNKKLLLFNQSYQIIFQKSEKLPETLDEDGDPCESVESLTNFIHEALEEVLLYQYYEVKAVNFAAYGASFVFCDDRGKPVCPLYNYLKPYPDTLLAKFYDQYGGKDFFSLTTASPVLGNLNSGMQLYRLKHLKPDIFQKIHHAFHLPQFLSFVLSGKAYSELTSVGCHTNLWNFRTHAYHEWVTIEGILDKLPPLVSSDITATISYEGHVLKIGTGLHDSSANLIPYLKTFSEPFILISTGTWSISLNPFNNAPLTLNELERDSLCYLTYTGQPVKASRFFAGHEYDLQIKRIASHFNKNASRYESLKFDPAMAATINLKDKRNGSDFSQRDLSDFSDDTQAYYHLMFDLTARQYRSTQLVLDATPIRRVFVDGGFCRNAIFMNFMAMFFPDMEIYAASIAHGTALGAALALHETWNPKAETANLIHLEHYPKPELVGRS